MVCIHCGGKTQIINSRLQRRNNNVWRRRRCLACHSIFTTIEVAEYSAAWLIRDHSGHIQPFSRDRLLLSLYDSCQHRKNALADAGSLTETVIRKLQAVARDGTLESKAISQMALVSLNRFDKAASTRYAALHTI